MLVAVLAVAATLYTWRLDRAPVFISNDEAHFALHAYAIATTGGDLTGTRFPLFVEMIDPLVPDNHSTAWWQPVLFYATSLSLAIFPFTEWSIRLPVVLIGLANIALVYAVARQMFAGRALSVIAGLLIALTPAHLIMSRQALDYICPVPFALGWLWCLGRFLTSGQARFLCVSGILLGAGTFSHISAWALMPLFAVVTLGALTWHRSLGGRALAAFGLGIALPWALATLWLVRHPQVFVQLIGRYGITTPTASGGERTLSLFEKLSLYWEYFSPSFLFFAGGSNPTQTTSQAGVYLLPLAILIAAGSYAILRRSRILSRIILLCFISAPLPVVAVMGAASDYSIARAIMLVPFGVLIAIHGVEWLCHSARPARVLLVVLLAGVPLQFAVFVKDYFGDYQLRVAPRLDALNTRDVAGFVIERHRQSPVPAVYLSDDLDSKAVRWRVHLWKAKQYDLFERTRYFEPALIDPARVAAGSLLVFFHGDPLAERLMETGGYTRATIVTFPAGDPASVILERNR